MRTIKSILKLIATYIKRKVLLRMHNRKIRYFKSADGITYRVLFLPRRVVVKFWTDKPELFSVKYWNGDLEKTISTWNTKEFTPKGKEAIDLEQKALRCVAIVESEW